LYKIDVMRVVDAPIERPCEVRVELMNARDEGRRYCAGCQKDVHFLSAMTEPQARRFLARTAGEDVCVRYAYDCSGRIQFAQERRPALVRLPIAVGVAAVLAGTTPGCAKQPSTDQSASIAAASAAPSARSAETQRREAGLKRQLEAAEDEANRKRLEQQLLELQRESEHAAACDIPGHKHTHIAMGKMQRDPQGQKSSTRCDCPPGDPLCTCL
jgi:hypothetical protein